MLKISYNLDVKENGIENIVKSTFPEESLKFLKIGEYTFEFAEICNKIRDIAKNKNNLFIYAQTVENTKKKLDIKISENYKKLFLGKYEIDSKEFIDYMKFMFAKPVFQSLLGESFKAAGLTFYAIAESKNPFFEYAHKGDENGQTINDFIEMLQIGDLFEYLDQISKEDGKKYTQ